MSKHLTMHVSTSTAPVVKLTGEGSSVYVYFQPGVKIARTVNKSTWPVVNIDLAADGSVVGVEAVGLPEFTLQYVLDQAGLKVPVSVAKQARYLHAESVSA